MRIQLSSDEPLYCITLSNYATPSFITADTWYAGTRAMLDHFFDVLDRQNRENPPDTGDFESYEETIVKQYRRYQAGETEVKAFCSQLIRPITLCHLTAPMETAPISLTHTNVWSCPYFIAADRARFQLAYGACEGKYFRFALADFENGRFGISENKLDLELDGPFWGHPAMLGLDGSLLYDRLMFLERRFDSREEMEADIAAPAAVDYTGFFNDFFGDG